MAGAAALADDIAVEVGAAAAEAPPDAMGEGALAEGKAAALFQLKSLKTDEKNEEDFLPTASSDSIAAEALPPPASASSANCSRWSLWLDKASVRLLVFFFLSDLRLSSLALSLSFSFLSALPALTFLARNLLIRDSDACSLSSNCWDSSSSFSDPRLADSAAPILAESSTLKDGGAASMREDEVADGR